MIRVVVMVSALLHARTTMTAAGFVTHPTNTVKLPVGGAHFLSCAPVISTVPRDAVVQSVSVLKTRRRLVFFYSVTKTVEAGPKNWDYRAKGLGQGRTKIRVAVRMRNLKSRDTGIYSCEVNFRRRRGLSSVSLSEEVLELVVADHALKGRELLRLSQEPRCPSGAEYTPFLDTCSCVDKTLAFYKHYNVCDLACGIGYTYSGKGNCSCLPPKEVDPTNNKCLLKCPTDAEPDTAKNTCVCSLENEYYDTVQRECVLKCPVGSHVDNVTQTCVCQSGTTYRSDLNQCVLKCPVGSHVDNVTQTCVCQSGTTYRSDLNQCVTVTTPKSITCPNGSEPDAKQTTCVCDLLTMVFSKDHNKCVPPCYDDATINDAGTECVCENKSHVYDSQGQICVKKMECPTGTKVHPTHYQICVCDNKAKTFDNATQTCVCEQDCPVDSTMHPENCTCKCDTACPPKMKRQGANSCACECISPKDELKNGRCVPAYVPCIEKWTLFPKLNICVKVISDLKTWPESRRWCMRNGGDLVLVPDFHMDDFLNDLASKTLFLQPMWIGLSDTSVEGKFTWVGSSNATEYTNWMTDTPDGGEQENCVYKEPDYGGRWDDRPCEEKRFFICQRPTEQRIDNDNTTVPPPLFPWDDSDMVTLIFLAMLAIVLCVVCTLMAIPDSCMSKFDKKFLGEWYPGEDEVDEAVDMVLKELKELDELEGIKKPRTITGSEDDDDDASEPESTTDRSKPVHESSSYHSGTGVDPPIGTNSSILSFSTLI